MRRILHISDLHFGKDRPELVDPLVRAINQIAPDLVALSGDLTQRALPDQFAQARAFIDRLEPRLLVVPGNHDVPLYNILDRLFTPFRAWRKAISPELEPEYEDDEMQVLGVNTVDPYAWQRGLITRRTLRRLCRTFSMTKPGKFRIVVVHHPLEHLPGQKKKLMAGAERAVERLSDCGADLILSGHLHLWRAEYFTLKTGRRTPIQVHAGTGLSTRVRGEENDFNLITLDRGLITVSRYVAEADASGFALADERLFRERVEGD